MIEDVLISGNSTIGSILTVSYTRTDPTPEGNTEFQRYIDGVAIEGENSESIQVLQGGEYIVAILPVDENGNEGEIVYSDAFIVQEEIEEPVSKEYLIKAYDKDFDFVKVIPLSIITNDIQYTESINSGQGQLVLNLNLPIDTDYLDEVKYIKVFVNSNNGLENALLYSGYLSKYSRLFSNNKENVQATFLPLFSLLSEVYYKDSEGNDEFTVEGVDPATFIKDVIDYFNESYSGIITYTNDSIVNYGSNINVECKNSRCSELLQRIVDGLEYYFYVGADGIVQFKPKSSTIQHEFTYEKDITALTIPTDFEQIANAVRVKYGIDGGENSGITDRAEDQESIEKFGRKEKTILNQNIFGNTPAEIYRDSMLNKYSEGKQNIKLTVNNKYLIESIHPGETIKIRNIGLDIDGLQISSVEYSYEQASLQLEYRTTLAEQIFEN